MTDLDTRPIDPRLRLVVIFALGSVCLAIYLQTLGFDFINIDDRPYVYENQFVTGGLSFSSIIWSLTATYSANWHPLTWMSHMLDVSLFGLNPGMHHAVNMVLHTINAILAFLAFERLTGAVWRSAIVAALFAVHPMHVESVAWIAERKDLLSTAFWWLTMLSYLKYVDLRSAAAELSSSRSKKAKKSAPAESTGSLLASEQFWLVVTTISFALGLMAKPMLVTLPFILLLCDLWPLARLRRSADLKPLIVEKLPLFALTLMSSVVTWYAQSSFGAAVSLTQIPVSTRLINVVTSYAKYIVALFYPVNMGVWYPFEDRADPFVVIGSIILLLGITVFCWQERIHRKYLMMGWLWFVITLIPVIGLIQVGLQSMADRYTYVPYFGLFVMIVWGVNDIAARWRVGRQAALAAAAVAIIAFGALAYRQASFWQNSSTLYEHTLTFTSNNYFLMSNLCLHYINTASVETADSKCTELLEATPPSVDALNILGKLRTDLGKYSEAIEYYKGSLKLDPASGVSYALIATAYAKHGELADAEKAIKLAADSRDPSLTSKALADATVDVGDALSARGQNERAKEYFRRAAALDPENTRAADSLNRADGR